MLLVGVRQPNPYENVRIFLEFAIYQTHVNIALFCVDEPVFDEIGMLTSWTILQGILRIEASWFLMRIQVLGT